jgi:hypothetical protein
MAYPDYNQILNEIWGWGNESSGMLPWFTLASNIVVGTNPPYNATDFLALYPQFGGVPAEPLGTLDGISGVVTAVSDFTGLATGQAIAGKGIASGSVITDVDEPNSTLTLSKNTTAVGTDVQLTVYVSPVIPLPILNTFIYLATNSILINRYFEAWYHAMGLYIAHYVTMWLDGQANGPGSTAGQLATAGLAMGVKTAKSVGDVSVGYRPNAVFDDWGTWGFTLYGQQLITLAKAWCGPVLVW